MMVDLLKEIENSISASRIVISSNIQNYFGSTRKESYIRGDITFLDTSSLEFSIYAIEEVRKIIFDKYRFQYMDKRKKPVFRYDNAPHHKKIPTFPCHKHLQDGKVIESSIPQFHEILEEITSLIVKSAP